MISPDFAKRLVERFGSPLYVYDLEQVERRAKELFSVLPPASKIFYSFKANPLPAIATVLRENGCHGEITSAGELKAALMAGFKPEQLLYGGPAKTPKEILGAMEQGIRRFSCESWTDLARLRCAAEKQNVIVEVLLRLNPPKAPHAKLAMTGVESQFGFEESALLSRANEIRSPGKHLKLIGIHVYYGTQIAVDALPTTTASAIETAQRVSSELGFDCKVVNAGGGFPWPYATHDAAPDLSIAKAGYADLLSQNEFARSAELWFESGRFLSASSGSLIATVLDVKESKGKKFVILDTGINHLGGMSGLGRIPRPFIGLQKIGGALDAAVEVADVVGPLCSPLDSLARNMKVPTLAPGDLVSVPNVGAYGLTASLIGFLSHPPPVEVAYRGETVISAFRLGWGHQTL